MLLSTYLLPHPPVMIPEVGKGSEWKCIDTVNGAKAVAKRIKELAPETIIVITPHGPVFSDGIAVSTSPMLWGNLSKFGSSEIEINVAADIELVNEIVGTSFENGITMAEIDTDAANDFGISTDLDHGTLVPLYFVNKEYEAYKLVHITYGLLSHEELYKFGMCIAKSIKTVNRNVVLIASGDLSHRLKDDGPYDYNANGAVFDQLMIDSLVQKDVVSIFEIDHKVEVDAGECGRRSIDIMLGSLEGNDFDSKKYSYEGPFGVGYGVVGFENIRESETRKFYDTICNIEKNKLAEVRSNEDEYVSLARTALEKYIRDGVKIDDFTHYDDEMTTKKAGVFVSIKNKSGLRGCIGTIGPVHACIAEEIVANAISAGTKDPRFPEILSDELEGLTITVDVLSKAETVRSIEELDPIEYGVIVSKDYKRGVLLPNLDGIDTVEEQIRVVLAKAGIEENENYMLERFLVVRHY